MNPKMIAKIGVDIGMTIVLLFLMTYEMIGQAFHEWLGIGMFLLFIIHHVLNRRWFGVLLKGKYTPFRIWQTVLVVSVLLSMIAPWSVVSLFPQCSLFSADPWRKLCWKKTSYAVSVLGVCIDVTSSWAALEYDAGSGGKSSKRNFKDSHLHASHYCSSGGCIRHVCFCKAGHRELYAVKGSLCVF